VHRRYARQTNPLWLARDGQRDYWASYRQKFDLAEWKKNRERLQQIRGLQKDETALIVEIFGVDVDKQRLKEEGIDNESRGWNLNGDLAWLPESKRGPVEKYLEDCQDKAQEFYASVRGGWDAETRAKEKQLEAEKLAGLAQFLTPQEVREYELRNSQTASQIASDLHGVSISREQYEALFDVRNKYGDSIYNYSDDANDAGAIAQIEQNKKDMQAEIAAAMGTDKASELERVQDFSYQALAGLARHNDLPADTAPKIYDYKQTAEKAVQDLDANLDLTPDQRQAALQQIRAETEQSVRTALGDKLYKRYLKNEGWWIHNLAPTADK
jgi:hypothetical protein